MSDNQYPEVKITKADICGHKLGVGTFCTRPPGHGDHGIRVLTIEVPLETGDGRVSPLSTVAMLLTNFAVQYAAGERTLTEAGDRYNFGTYLSAEVKER